MNANDKKNHGDGRSMFHWDNTLAALAHWGQLSMAFSIIIHLPSTSTSHLLSHLRSMLVHNIIIYHHISSNFHVHFMPCWANWDFHNLAKWVKILSGAKSMMITIRPWSLVSHLGIIGRCRASAVRKPTRSDSKWQKRKKLLCLLCLSKRQLMPFGIYTATLFVGNRPYLRHAAGFTHQHVGIRWVCLAVALASCGVRYQRTVRTRMGSSQWKQRFLAAKNSEQIQSSWEYSIETTSASGWCLSHPSEKWWTNRQLGLWHSQYMESHKIHVPNHQPGLILGFSLQILGMIIQAIEDCEACSDSKILALVAHENPQH